MALDLNTSPRTSVFRKIESILKNDPTLKRVGVAWLTWIGKEAIDNQDLLPAVGRPSIRLTPVGSEESFVFPDAQRGVLTVGVEAAIAGTFADDVLNLWWAIERAIYPKNQTAKVANQQALQQAGAATGLCTFSSPMLSQDEGATNWYISGQIKIDVLLNLNT